MCIFVTTTIIIMIIIISIIIIGSIVIYDLTNRRYWTGFELPGWLARVQRVDVLLYVR